MDEGRQKMAILSIRNLPDEVHVRLRVRAAQAGRSMESEARAILAAACMAEDHLLPAADLQTWVDELYRASRPSGVVESLIAMRREEAGRE